MEKERIPEYSDYRNPYIYTIIADTDIYEVSSCNEAIFTIRGPLP